MSTPRDKPKEILWDAEWVAMHTDFEFPEVSDAGFLAEFKKVMIEVAGDRLYDYQAAEQVEACLVAGGVCCPGMEAEAAADGSTRYSKIKDYIGGQMGELHEAAQKWRGAPPRNIETDPLYADILEREIQQRDEARAAKDAASKAAEIAGYPKREDWK